MLKISFTDMCYLDDLVAAGFPFVLLAISVSTDGNGNHSVLHMVGYPENPTPTDQQLLIDELKTDRSFGMMGLTHRTDYELISYDQYAKYDPHRNS